MERLWCWPHNVAVKARAHVGNRDDADLGAGQKLPQQAVLAVGSHDVAGSHGFSGASSA
jgi:hypothetical protein